MKILEYPNPILLSVAKPVSLPLDLEELDLIKNMWQAVQKIGVGLAAPQVGISKQILIIHMGEDKDLAKQVKEPEMVMINPKIIFKSEVENEMIEGCLSFPDEYWKIWRPANITVEYDTILNFVDFVKKNAKPIYTKKKLNAKNWLSRIIQHEIDHLEGKLFIKMGGVKIRNND